MPNIYKNNWKKKSQNIRDDDSKDNINIVNNSKGSIPINENRYNYHKRLQQSIPRNNKNYINYKNELLNKDIILPNLFGINKSGVFINNPSPKKNINLNINIKNKSNGSYKILNSENNIVLNNLNNIKVIDGKNIHVHNKNSNSIDLKKKKIFNSPT